MDISRINVERLEVSRGILLNSKSYRRTFHGTINFGSFGQIKVNIATMLVLDVGVFRVSWLLSRWVKRRDR